MTRCVSKIEYNRDLYRNETIEELLKNLNALIYLVASHTEKRIKDIVLKSTKKEYPTTQINASGLVFFP